MTKHEQRARRSHDATSTGAAAAMAFDPAGEQATAESAIAHDVIALLAYSYWEARGCPYGSPEEDWFHAEQDLQRNVAAVA